MALGCLLVPDFIRDRANGDSFTEDGAICGTVPLGTAGVGFAVTGEAAAAGAGNLGAEASACEGGGTTVVCVVDADG